tara:strand:+ start:119 stop:922 length:804 start_codon:yes stop_codon:yes gene_type:complete
MKNLKKGTLPIWQKYLSKYDVNKDGVTSGKELKFAAKEGIKSLFSNVKPVVDSMADTTGGAGINTPDGKATPSEYVALAASFITPGGFLKGGGKSLASKTKNLFKGNKVVSKTTSKNSNFKHFGNTEFKDIKNITNITRSKAQLLDKANLKNAKFTPFSTNTPRMGMKVDFGDGLTQNYYNSSSLGNKKFTQGINKGKGTFDKWIAFEGKANLPNNKNWFVKEADFETGYGSKMNEYMMDNLDKHIDPKIAKAATDEVMAFKNKYIK